jgi:4-hydroxy-4-methyl-2-oxoglutarate aldolase
VTSELLEELRGLSTPAVANAIDALDLRSKLGFSPGPGFGGMFPELGPVVGFAATVVVSAQPDSGVHRHQYWEYLASVPAPRIVVVYDQDDDAAQGAFLGEVNGAIHRGLGCVAALTNGGVRDLPELLDLGLQVFGGSPITSAGYMHIVSFGAEVPIGRLTVRSRDLLHGDQHGVLLVPDDAVERIPAAAADIRRKELEVVDLYRSGHFDLARLKEIRPR